MAHAVVQLEAEREYVVVVGAIAHDKGAVRFAGEHLFGRLAGQGTPIPAVLGDKIGIRLALIRWREVIKPTSLTFSMLDVNCSARGSWTTFDFSSSGSDLTASMA